jgi:hypothetical protein
LRGQQKNRPTNISAGVLTFLLLSRHVYIPDIINCPDNL